MLLSGQLLLREESRTYGWDYCPAAVTPQEDNSKQGGFAADDKRVSKKAPGSMKREPLSLEIQVSPSAIVL